MDGSVAPAPIDGDVSETKNEDQTDTEKIQELPEDSVTKQVTAEEPGNEQKAEPKEDVIVETDDLEKNEAAEESVISPKTDEDITLEQKPAPATEDNAQSSEVGDTASSENTLEAEDNATASGGLDPASDAAVAMAMAETESSGLGLDPDMTAIYLDWKEEEECIAANKKLADEHKKEGTRLLNAGKGQEAVEEYTLAISLDPESHVLHANRSLAHAKNGSHQASLFDAEETIRLRPKWAKGFIRKGLALKSLGRLNEAVETLEQGLKIDPDDEELKTSLRDCETEIEKRSSSSPPVNMENFASFTGIGGEDMDLPTLLAIQESLKEFADGPSISAGNKPNISDFAMNEPKQMDEPKRAHADFMISDPKGNKNEWERYMSAPKINLPKTRPKNTNSGSKDSYAEPKKSTFGDKSQQSERKSGYSQKKTRRHRFVSSSDSDSEDDLKSKSEPAKVKSAAQQSSFSKPRIIDSDSQKKTRHHRFVSSSDSDSEDNSKTKSESAEAKSTARQSRLTKTKSSDSDSDWRPKSKRTEEKIKQVDRKVADPKPKISEVEQKRNSEPKQKIRSKPKFMDSDQSDEESDDTSSVKINMADFIISDPKKDYVEPEPKARDSKPKQERFKPKSTDSEPVSSQRKINQTKPGSSEVKQKVSNRRSEVDEAEPEKSNLKSRSGRSKPKSDDSDDDSKQKRLAKSKISDRKQRNDEAEKKTGGSETKSNEAETKSVDPEELNKFMKAMKEIQEAEATGKAAPKRKERKPKLEEPETQIIEPEPKLSSEPLVEFNVSELRVVDKEKAKKEKASGTDHSKRDDFENAHKHYDNAIKFDPTDISLYSNKALVYMKQNMPEKVREYSQKVILVWKNFGGDEWTVGKSYSRIAKTFLEQKEYRTALENFKKAMELNPCNATSENIKLCKKKIRQQEISEAVEDEDTPYPQLKHDFLLEERSRCLTEELKFYEAISLFEDLDSVDEGDIGMKLLTAECYIQLGREGKAEKAVRSVEKMLLRPPMCEIDDVMALANDFTGNATPVRALILFRIVGDMLKSSDRQPNEIVSGLFRCIAKMNDPVSAMLKKPEEEKEKSNMEEMRERHQQMLEHYASTQKAIGMSDEAVHFGIDPPKATPSIIKNRRKKTVVVDERSRVIAIDYGVEVMEELLDDLRSIEDADREIIAIKQAILCNMINNSYSVTGQHEKAIRLLRNGVWMLEKEFGQDANQHRIYITMLVNIGAELHNSEKFYEAEQIELRALDEIDYVLDYNGEEERQQEIKRIRESLRITRLHLKLA